MNVLKTISLILILLLTSCAGVSSYRMDRFEEVERFYRQALRDSDFKEAARFVDPATNPDTDNPDRFKQIKVADYKTNKTTLSDNKLEIQQEVEIQYYHQNKPVLKTLEDNQVWTYHSDDNVWLLKSGLPKFK